MECYRKAQWMTMFCSTYRLLKLHVGGSLRFRRPFLKNVSLPSFQYDIIKNKLPSRSSETILTIKSLFTFPKTAIDLKLCCYCPQSLLLTSRTVRWKCYHLTFYFSCIMEAFCSLSSDSVFLLFWEVWDSPFAWKWSTCSLCISATEEWIFMESLPFFSC